MKITALIQPTTEPIEPCYEFGAPLLAGLLMGLQKRLPQTLQAAFAPHSEIYPSEFQITPKFDECSLLLAEDYKTSPPYMILTLEDMEFAAYEGRLIPLLYTFTLTLVTAAPDGAEAVMNAELMQIAAINALLKLKEKDFWRLANPATALNATLQVKRARRLPSATDGNQPVQQRVITFTVKTNEGLPKK